MAEAELQFRDGPHPVDLHIGNRIREIRVRLGLSQTALGERVGVTVQQMHEYEDGYAHIPCSLLYEIARVLGVVVFTFFDGADRWQRDSVLGASAPPQG